MRVVVDSNVWVSGLIRPDGPPGRILNAILEERIEVVSSWELVDEVSGVLSRPKLARYRLAAGDVRDLLRSLARTLPTVDVDVDIRDPDDAPVVAAAVAGKADAIVTGDGDLLEDAELREWLIERGVAVLTPAELIARLGPGRRS
ncbi:MAG TPA: putative toxin-antitoxin system toxin component, PIN family [Gaiellaceae bacterium]|nr:putative toxin-antitoxin system toxin component, PIN family [Gaiellaceae bacterium]